MVANEVLRFASVRAINTTSAEGLSKRYISVKDDTDVAAVAKAEPNTRFLLLSLNDFRDYSQERLRVLIEGQRTTNKFIVEPKDFEAAYPFDFNRIHNWARTNPNAKLSELITKLTQLFGQPDKSGAAIKNFVDRPAHKTEKMKLYETLAAYYLHPQPEYFLDSIQEQIRFFWVLQRIAAPNEAFAPELADSPEAIIEAINATIVLPYETGYAEAPRAETSVEPPEQKEADAKRENARKRLAELNRAANEIERKRKVQAIDSAHAAKYRVNRERDDTSCPPSGPNFLAARYVAGLSEGTHSVIDSFRVPKDDGVDVEHILARINAERDAIALEHYPAPGREVVLNVNGRFFQTKEPCTPYVYDPCAKYPRLRVECKKTPMRTPGWADLKVIKSTLLKYEKGEIAHIENILKGEIKIREFNVTTRTEESLFTEEEVTKESEKESQTTDRFELERELATQVKEDMKFDTGVKVSAKLGTVQLDTHLDFAYSRSKEDSSKTSTRTAQETLNRALSKVIERKKTQRTVTTIVTTEDKNSHTLKNDVAPTDNIHGTYFWIDKYYLAKVVNYGSRFMLEFMVPEPAAFYLHSKANKPQPDTARDKPDFPQVRGTTGEFRNIESFKDISEENFASLAAKYHAEDVKPPDPATQVITESVLCKGDGKEVVASDKQGGEIKYKEVLLANKALQIPAGYIPETGWVTVAGWGVDINLPSIQIMLGNIKRQNADFSRSQEFYPLNEESLLVPLGAWGYNVGEFVINVEIKCNRTTKCLDEWKIKTFNSILTAYERELSDFENWRKAQEINSGIQVQGENPEVNRKIEREEIKKLCIELMTGQYFEAFNAVDNNVLPSGYPEVVPSKAFEEGKIIQFFEQAFEWEQATYSFYPYFWGRKPNWVMVKSFNDTDPIFTSFLQAGAARVLVPARPGFEDSVNFYLSTGRIWHGMNPPIPGDKLWISVADELKAQQGLTKGGREEGTPWIYKMPTSLVYLESTQFKIEDTDLSAKYPGDLKQIEDAKTSADFS